MPGNAKISPPGGVLIPVEATPWSNQRYYSLRRDRTTIGRASDCDIQINHRSVSRRHAELSWVEGTPIIVHLSPANPTLVNGLPITQPHALRTGDLIEVAGGIVFRLELFGQGDELTEQRRRDERRMYAIVCTDVVGYSRLVENDDVATARQLEVCIDAIRLQGEAANGRIVQTAGDNLVLLFTSATSAMNSTIAWLRTVRSLNSGLNPERQMEFRVGINSGDILITPVGGIHGDAINIAARLQTLAPPGGILVAGVVRDQLQGQEDLHFEYIRSNELKNLSREVRIYRVVF